MTTIINITTNTKEDNMTEDCNVRIILENITREKFEELIDQDWGKWGKPDKSYINTLLFFSLDDYRVQLTYDEKLKEYIVIVFPRKNSEFSSMEEIENILKSFLETVIDSFNNQYKTNVHMCVENV